MSRTDLGITIYGGRVQKALSPIRMVIAAWAFQNEAITRLDKACTAE